MSAAILLYAVAGVPIGLTLLALLPASRAVLIHTLPFAALPALGAALFLPAGSTQTLPAVLLGAQLALDGTGRLFLGIAALLWTLAGIYARSSIGGAGQGRFAGFWLTTLSGNMLLLVAADLVTFYLAFVTLSLAAFGLVVHSGTGEARRASRIYLALAVFGETLLLLGLMVAAAGAGSILIGDARAALPLSPYRDLALALLLGGFGLKAGLVPLHMWLPLAHPAAPVPASAVLSGAIVSAGIFGLIRFLPLEADLPGWSIIMTVLGLVTSFYGILAGVFQPRPKTVLAYSTLSQMGLVIVILGSGFGAAAVAPVLAAAGFYVAHHGLAKGALFLSVGLLHDTGGRWRMAALGVTAVLALAIAGLPLTGGALAKLAAKETLGSGLVATLVTLSAAGSTLLMLRFVQLVRREQVAPHTRPQAASAVAFTICAAAALILPWLLLPGTGLAASYVFDGAVLWQAVWPIAIGFAVFGTALRIRRPAPEVPEGDIVVFAERLFYRLKEQALAISKPAWSVPRLRRIGIVSAPMLDRAEAALARWSLAGPAVLFVGIAAAVASS